MIVPAIDPGHVIVLALCPDMVLKYETEENPGEDTAYRLAGAVERTGVLFTSPYGPCRPRRLRNEREQVLPTRCSHCFRTILSSGIVCWAGATEYQAISTRAAHDLGAGRCRWAISASRSDRAGPSRRPILMIGSGSPRSYSPDVRYHAPGFRA